MANKSGEPLEIERKFLLVGESWREQVVGEPKRLSQGYLCADAEKSVRVRIAGDYATLTVKGSRNGISRLEMQYTIPVADAERMLALCAPHLIDKTRHIVMPLRTRTLEMDGLPFIQRWALPNFYFHVTATYSLLRQAGVDVGKQDFLGGV